MGAAHHGGSERRPILPFPSPIGQINILGDTGLVPSFQQQQVPFLFIQALLTSYLNEIPFRRFHRSTI